MTPSTDPLTCTGCKTQLTVDTGYIHTLIADVVFEAPSGAVITWPAGSFVGVCSACSVLFTERRIYEVVRRGWGTAAGVPGTALINFTIAVANALGEPERLGAWFERRTRPAESGDSEASP